MEYQNGPQQDIFTAPQKPLPNATATLVLGILSIVMCFICGIIAMAISSNDKKLYQQDPQLYTSGSYEMIRAGRICSIISFWVWGFFIFIYIVIIFFAVGTAALT